MSGPVRNTLIYNNTIHVGQNENVALVLHSDWNGRATTTSLFNHIFYDEGSAHVSYNTACQPDRVNVAAPGTGKSSVNLFDSNVYYGVQAQPGVRGRTRDPLLNRPSGARIGRQTASGYRLRAGSAALDSGRKSDNKGSRDFFGTAIPRGGGIEPAAAETTHRWSDQ
jgi:hypothetical protein